MSDSNTAVAAPPNDLSRSTPGEYLRKLREEKGHTHATVSAALHLTVHYIKALEGDEYGKLPGLTFVKGYLRSYARFLGADVDNVLARFDEHITGLLDAGQHTARIERSKRRQDQALRWAIGAGLVAVVGIAAGWWFMRDAAPVADTAQRSVGTTVSPQLAAAPATSSATTQSPAPAISPPATAYTPPAQATMPATADQAALVAGDQDALVPTAPDGQSALAPAAMIDQNSLAPAALVEQNPPVPAASAEFSGTDSASVAPEQATGVASDAAAATPTANGITAAITPAVNGARQVSLIGAGDDELRVHFTGSSWIEVDDGSMVRLYNDMLSAGDTLTIRGQAPFRVLLGAASNVDVSLNAAPVDFSSAVRTDNTARLVLGAPGGAPGSQVSDDATPAVASGTPAAPAAADTTNPSVSTDAEVSQ